ncbi:DUF1499 domain-containing protein [Aliidiomarina sanyensis]|uniref:DUF1499 domain-containing protein n=1 Tax=Aliidiomarina sanyensis TaxID=1249555 RepID=A0A432WPQ3_9GAMM|nr:DUF1499 domain-containing protein [Aliidiomarina sanyensis]RUO35772.1 DUF1499 domain-containing protein [Aliidiomarina sanyensis]
MKKILCYTAGISGFLAIFILAIAGPLYQVDIVHFRTSFQMMRWAAYLGIASVVLVVLALFILKPKHGKHRLILLTSLLLGLLAFYLPFQQYQTAQSVPRIHDITTDTVNPPAFIAIAPLRADAPNPVEYPGEETAQLQQAAYPDIQTMRFTIPAPDVYAAALRVVERAGWELVEANANEGRIEATASTRWFGFKDDVVIRIVADGGDTLLDMRSKSRIGLSDVGANANRIRAFRDRLERELD